MAKKKKEKEEKEDKKEEATAEDNSNEDEDEVEEDLPELSKDAQKILETVEQMSVLELNALVKALEKKFGVSATAPVAVAAAPTAGGAGEEVEEKSKYDVVLAEAGGNKLAVIKAVREINQSLGLKDAKELVESAPKPVAEGVKKEEAEEAKEKLTEAGAKVELK